MTRLLSARIPLLGMLALAACSSGDLRATEDGSGTAETSGPPPETTVVETRPAFEAIEVVEALRVEGAELTNIRDMPFQLDIVPDGTGLESSAAADAEGTSGTLYVHLDVYRSAGVASVQVEADPTGEYFALNRTLLCDLPGCLTTGATLLCEEVVVTLLSTYVDEGSAGGIAATDVATAREKLASLLEAALDVNCSLS